MSGRIYIQKPDGEMVPLDETAYDAEEVLQAELANHPDLLAGEQMNPSEPRRWLLIKREAGIPDTEDGGNRWSVDHVFLDQDAIPTFVEAKRKSDTRLRREVIGQVFDYVSNAVAYWTDETLQAEFVRDCEVRGEDSDALLEAFVGDPDMVDDFWDRARTNLRAGRVRIVVVADELPPELKRIVEFLNNQTDPMEILAVEVRRYEGQGLAVLVPRVIGLTTEAQARKRVAREKRSWDWESLLRAFERNQSDEMAAAAEQIMQWATAAGLRLAYGEGAVNGTVYPMLDLPDGTPVYTFSLWTNGRIEVPFNRVAQHEPYSTEDKRHELRELLNAIPGFDIPADGIDRYPTIPFANLLDGDSMETFLGIWADYLEQVTAANP